MHALLRAMSWLVTAIEAAGGRVIDATGDNLMAEFAAEGDAVRAALYIQRATDERELSESTASLRFRLGVHSGALLCRDDRRFGNVVNIAARLQRLAEDGGLLVSEATYERLPAPLRESLFESAPLECRNIPRPVSAFRGFSLNAQRNEVIS